MGTQSVLCVLRVRIIPNGFKVKRIKRCVHLLILLNYYAKRNLFNFLLSLQQRPEQSAAEFEGSVHGFAFGLGDHHFLQAAA